MSTPTTLQCAFRDALRRLSASCQYEVNIDEEGSRTADLIDCDQATFDALVQEVNVLRRLILDAQQERELQDAAAERMEHAEFLHDLARGK